MRPPRPVQPLPGLVGEGSALKFDGTSTYVDCGDQFDFQGNVPFTLEAWVRADVVDSTYRHVISKNNFGSGSSLRQEYALNVTSSEGVKAERIINAIAVNAATKPFDTHVVRYIVLVYTGNVVELQVDGVATRTNDGRAAFPISPGRLVVGALDAQNSFFDGVIDEVAIYDTALSDTRIAAHYAAGKSR